MPRDLIRPEGMDDNTNVSNSNAQGNYDPNVDLFGTGFDDDDEDIVMPDTLTQTAAANDAEVAEFEKANNNKSDKFLKIALGAGIGVVSVITVVFVVKTMLGNNKPKVDNAPTSSVVGTDVDTEGNTIKETGNKALDKFDKEFTEIGSWEDIGSASLSIERITNDVNCNKVYYAFMNPYDQESYGYRYNYSRDSQSIDTSVDWKTDAEWNPLYEILEYKGNKYLNLAGTNTAIRRGTGVTISNFDWIALDGKTDKITFDKSTAGLTDALFNDYMTATEVLNIQSTLKNRYVISNNGTDYTGGNVFIQDNKKKSAQYSSVSGEADIEEDDGSDTVQDFKNNMDNMEWDDGDTGNNGSDRDTVDDFKDNLEDMQWEDSAYKSGDPLPIETLTNVQPEFTLDQKPDVSDYFEAVSSEKKDDSGKKKYRGYSPSELISVIKKAVVSKDTSELHINSNLSEDTKELQTQINDGYTEEDYVVIKSDQSKYVEYSTADVDNLIKDYDYSASTTYDFNTQEQMQMFFETFQAYIKDAIANADATYIAASDYEITYKMEKAVWDKFMSGLKGKLDAAGFTYEWINQLTTEGTQSDDPSNVVLYTLKFREQNEKEDTNDNIVTQTIKVPTDYGYMKLSYKTETAPAEDMKIELPNEALNQKSITADTWNNYNDYVMMVSALAYYTDQEEITRGYVNREQYDQFGNLYDDDGNLACSYREFKGAELYNNIKYQLQNEYVTYIVGMQLVDNLKNGVSGDGYTLLFSKNYQDAIASGLKLDVSDGGDSESSDSKHKLFYDLSEYTHDEIFDVWESLQDLNNSLFSNMTIIDSTNTKYKIKRKQYLQPDLKKYLLDEDYASSIDKLNDIVDKNIEELMHNIIPYKLDMKADVESKKQHLKSVLEIKQLITDNVAPEFMKLTNAELLSESLKAEKAGKQVDASTDSKTTSEVDSKASEGIDIIG